MKKPTALEPASVYAFSTEYTADRSEGVSGPVCGSKAEVARIVCPSMMGNLFRTRLCDGRVATSRSEGGEAKGSKGFLSFGMESALDVLGVGFFAREGQKRSWKGGTVGRIDTSVGEKMRAPEETAEEYFCRTREGRLGGREDIVLRSMSMSEGEAKRR